MLITTNSPIANARPASRVAAPSPTSTAPVESGPAEVFTPSTPTDAKPRERYKAWVPLANAGVVAALVAVPAFAGAAGNALFGAHPMVTTGVGAVTAAGAGTWAYKSSKKEFNGHPVLVGLSTLTVGTVSLLAAPILSIPGAAYGWKGAAIATAAAAIGTGVVSAFGIHHANKEIDRQNAALGIQKQG